MQTCHIKHGDLVMLRSNIVSTSLHSLDLKTENFVRSYMMPIRRDYISIVLYVCSPNDAWSDMIVVCNGHVGWTTSKCFKVLL